MDEISLESKGDYVVVLVDLNKNGVVAAKSWQNRISRRCTSWEAGPV